MKHRFEPPVEDAQLKIKSFSYAPNTLRGSLFAGQTFLFASRAQLEKVREVVMAAGGVAVEYNSTCASTPLHMRPNTVRVLFLFHLA